MAKVLSAEDQQERAARRASRKLEVAKIKRFKHNMEVVRTLCAILAVTLNIGVLSHVLGFWK